MSKENTLSLDDLYMQLCQKKLGTITFTTEQLKDLRDLHKHQMDIVGENIMWWIENCTDEQMAAYSEWQCGDMYREHEEDKRREEESSNE